MWCFDTYIYCIMYKYGYICLLKHLSFLYSKSFQIFILAFEMNKLLLFLLTLIWKSHQNFLLLFITWYPQINPSPSLPSLPSFPVSSNYHCTLWFYEINFFGSHIWVRSCNSLSGHGLFYLIKISSSIHVVRNYKTLLFLMAE